MSATAPAGGRPVKLVAVSAGLSTPSGTRLLADRLAEAVHGELGPQGHEVDSRVIELRELAVAIANHLVTEFPSPPPSTP